MLRNYGIAEAVNEVRETDIFQTFSSFCSNVFYI